MIIILLSDLQTKDVISINNGSNMGRIVDASIDSNGKIEYFVSEEKRLIRKVTRGIETTFSYEKIKKIGEDVILVDL